MGKSTETLQAVLEFVNKAGPGVKAAAKDFGGLGKAADAVKTALAAGGVVMAGKAAYELGVLGAQSLRTKRAFEAISGGAFTATSNLDAMRRATRGAMSEQAMMASANQLLQMGLASNATELEQITTMATRLGSAMGKEAGPAVEEFALMLANQSIPRLDTFGISASKVRSRILELQAATPGLSREVAFMQATMEQGTEAMERLGDAADDELQANERLEASMLNLKAMAGEALAPAMAEVASAMEKVVTQALSQVNELDAFTAAYGKAAIEAQVLKHGLWETADAGAEFNDMMAAAAERAEGVAAAVEGGRTRIDGWSSAIFGTADAADAAAGAMDGLSTSAKTVAGSFGEMEFDSASMWDMALASGAELDELEDLAKHLGIATDAEIQNTIEGYRLTEMFGAGALTAEQYAAGISALETATIDAAGGFEGLGADAAIAEKGLEGLRVAQAAAADATEDLGAKYGESGAELAAAEAARTEAIAGAQALEQEEAAAAQSAADLADAENRAASEAFGMNDAVREAGAGGALLSESSATAALKALGLQGELAGVTGEANNAAKEVETLAGKLDAMQGIYTVTVVYEERGKKPSVPPGDWPGGGHQSGTAFHRGGMALIGERGPELVELPRGSQVWSTSSPQTQAAVNNRYDYGGDTVFINDRLAAALYLEQRRRERIQRIERM